MWRSYVWSSFLASLCRARNEIMYVLLWWTFCVLTRVLFCIAAPVDSQLELNKHKNQTLVSTWTVRHIRSYIAPVCFYTSAFRRRRRYVLGLSEAWNNLFPPVHGSVGPSDQPWPFCGMSVRPSVHPSMFSGIYWRTHAGNDLKFCMLIYLDDLQNRLVYG